MKTKTALIQTLILMTTLMAGARAGAQTVTAVATSGYTSYFLRSDGSVLVAGTDQYGQWGTGPFTFTMNTNVPFQMALTNITAISAGDGYALFLRKDGVMLGVGYDAYGQLGNGSNLNVTVPTPLASNVMTIAACQLDSFYIDTSGNLYAAGLNQAGASGNGGGTSSFVNPWQLVLTGVKAAAGGYEHSIFLMNDTSLFGTGENPHGQFGLGTGAANINFQTNRPTRIRGAGVSAIACGTYFTMYITTDSNLWAMGDDTYGQLGDGISNPGDPNSYSPELIDSNVVSVVAGAYSTLYIKSDGSLWGMGYDNYGDLGNGKNVATNRPQLIVSNNVVAAANDTLNSADSIFIKKDGSVWAMGQNANGELGDGVYSQTNRPVQIMAATIQLPGLGLLTPPVFNMGLLQFSYQGQVGSNYALDRTFQLFPANWIGQSTNTAGSDGKVSFTNLAIASTNNFWRVRAVLK